MKYAAVTGGLLICTITVIAFLFRNGPASTTAAPTTQTGESSSPVSFESDPAEHFRNFSQDFVGHLNNLPAIRVEHRETDRNLYVSDITLRVIQEQIRVAEVDYGFMRAEERQHNIELSSLDGKSVLATPAEHLENMRATYEKYKKIREGSGDREAVSSRLMMDKVHWSAVYEMDARKTDSILTPYVGTIAIKGTWYSGEMIERETYRYKFSFSAQDGKWVLRSISRTRLLNIEKWQEVEKDGAEGSYFTPLWAP